MPGCIFPPFPQRLLVWGGRRVAVCFTEEALWPHSYPFLVKHLGAFYVFSHSKQRSANHICWPRVAASAQIYSCHWSVWKHIRWKTMFLINIVQILIFILSYFFCVSYFVIYLLNAWGDEPQQKYLVHVPNACLPWWNWQSVPWSFWGALYHSLPILCVWTFEVHPGPQTFCSAHCRGACELCEGMVALILLCSGGICCYHASLGRCSPGPYIFAPSEYISAWLPCSGNSSALSGIQAPLTVFRPMCLLPFLIPVPPL